MNKMKDDTETLREMRFGGKRILNNAVIRIVFSKGKNRAWCAEADSFIQFPNNLRELGAIYTANITEVKQKGKTTFYRVDKKSIEKWCKE